MNGMTFDAGTWWLIGLLATGLIGAVVFLIKRTLFSRVDDLTKEVKEVRDTTVKKADYSCRLRPHENLLSLQGWQDCRPGERRLCTGR